MKEQILDYLTPDEFEQLLDDFIQRDDEEIPTSTFFAALELIDREKRQQIIDWLASQFSTQARRKRFLR
jgi:hypothetical protein